MPTVQFIVEATSGANVDVTFTLPLGTTLNTSAPLLNGGLSHSFVSAGADSFILVIDITDQALYDEQLDQRVKGEVTTVDDNPDNNIIYKDLDTGENSYNQFDCTQLNICDSLITSLSDALEEGDDISFTGGGTKDDPLIIFADNHVLEDEDDNFIALSGAGTTLHRSLHIGQGNISADSLGSSSVDSDQADTGVVTNNHLFVTVGSITSRARGTGVVGASVFASKDVDLDGDAFTVSGANIGTYTDVSNGAAIGPNHVITGTDNSTFIGKAITSSEDDVIRLKNDSIIVETARFLIETAPLYASTAAAAADGTLASTAVFRIDNADGTAALHVKD